MTTIYLGTPTTCMADYNTLCVILSKAFSWSTKTRQEFLIFASTFFLELTDSKDGVSCPTHRYEAKLHIINIYTVSNYFFDDFSNNFQHLICKLQAMVVTAF